ncbi:MAG: hypothetical protein QXU50_02255 [Candidatus Korarchaeum sp.]
MSIDLMRKSGTQESEGIVTELRELREMWLKLLEQWRTIKGKNVKTMEERMKKLDEMLEWREQARSWEGRVLEWKSRLEAVGKRMMEEELERVMREWRDTEAEWRKEHLELTLSLLEERWESLGGGIAKLGELAEVDLEEEFE